jgi:hypothetical protein
VRRCRPGTATCRIARPHSTKHAKPPSWPPSWPPPGPAKPPNTNKPNALAAREAGHLDDTLRQARSKPPTDGQR